MNKPSIHQFHILLALLLSVVLVGSILIKPLHILLVHHSRFETVNIYSNQDLISVSYHHDCTICDFEFCNFIPQKQVVIPQVNIVFAIQLPTHVRFCFINEIAHQFQLRAPPAA